MPTRIPQRPAPPAFATLRALAWFAVWCTVSAGLWYLIALAIRAAIA